MVKITVKNVEINCFSKPRSITHMVSSYEIHLRYLATLV